MFNVTEERDRSPEALEAGILRDAVVRFTGKTALAAGLDRRLRIVEVKCAPHRKPSGHNGRGGPEQGETLLIVTDMLTFRGLMLTTLVNLDNQDLPATLSIPVIRLSGKPRPDNDPTKGP